MNVKPFELHICIIEHYQLDQLMYQKAFQVRADLEQLHGDVFQL